MFALEKSGYFERTELKPGDSIMFDQEGKVLSFFRNGTCLLRGSDLGEGNVFYLGRSGIENFGTVVRLILHLSGMVLIKRGNEEDKNNPLVIFDLNSCFSVKKTILESGDLVVFDKKAKTIGFHTRSSGLFKRCDLGTDDKLCIGGEGLGNFITAMEMVQFLTNLTAEKDRDDALLLRCVLRKPSA